MLPYRLKQKKRAERNINVIPTHTNGSSLLNSTYLIDEPGGPVQHAIRLDLLGLRQEFFDEGVGKFYRDSDKIPSKFLSHNVPGLAFRRFKEIFDQAKVALIHTRAVPPRCDRDSYSQVIYATCLSLLKDSFVPGKDTDQCLNKETKESRLLEYASFALFSLYVLYETNPLTTPPTSEGDVLKMLPLGLQSADNSKIKYRRAFKSPIRIDRNHYCLLLQLREECLARQAKCQLRCMEAMEPTTDEYTAINSASEWSCNCGIATDTLNVLERLLNKTPALFDLVEYSGPCGLEGFAGHEHYPYGLSRTQQKEREQHQPGSWFEDIFQKMTTEEISNAVQSEIKWSPDDIKDSLQTYLKDIKSIRLSPDDGRRSIRVKNALKPLWDQNSSGHWEKTIKYLSVLSGKSEMPRNHKKHESPETTTATKRSREEYIVTDVQKIGSGSNIFHDQAKNHIQTQAGNVEKLGISPFRLLLPNSLAESVQIGIKNAILKLSLDHGGDFPNTLKKGTNECPRKEPSANTLPKKDVTNMLNDRDDWSYSVASTHKMEKGQGRAALSELLSSCTTPNPHLIDDTLQVHLPPVATSESRHQFLTIGSNDDDDIQNTFSELSSDDDSNDDYVSAGGQKALNALLGEAGFDTPQEHNSTRRRKVSKKRSKPRPTIQERHVSSSDNEESDNEQSGLLELSPDDENIDDYVSVGGQKALSALLGEAEIDSPKKTSSTRPRNASKKRCKAPSTSTQKRASCKRRRQTSLILQQASSEDEEVSSVTGGGKVALDTLLSQVST